MKRQRPEHRGGGANPVRVLTVISTIEPEVGGPSYMVVNAVLAERASGLDTVLVSTVPAERRTPSDLDARLDAAGAPHLTFPRPRLAAGLMKRWGVSLGMTRWIFRNARRFDVIHVHYVWSAGTLIALLAGQLWRIPVVLTPHESLTTFGYDTSRSRWRRRQKLWLSRRILARVDVVFLSSELERSDSPIPEGMAVVIPHPVPDDGPVSASAVVDDGKPFTVGYLGRFHEKKRVGLLIEALGMLPADSRLVVGGNEPPEMLDVLRAESERLGLSDRIEFRGFVRESERLAFLAGVDVLAMPSAYECFGMVAAEAMTAGVPVVVTSRSGVAPFVAGGDAGLVFDVDAPETLAPALDELHGDPQRRRAMGANARQVAQDSFSYRSYATHTLREYERIS